MTLFFRLMNSDDKHAALTESIDGVNDCNVNKLSFVVNPKEFFNVPGAPFSYWVSSETRSSFSIFNSLESGQFTAKQGLATGDDFRFVRLSTEAPSGGKFTNFSKGGSFSPFYYDLHLCVNWEGEGAEIKTLLTSDGKVASRPQAISFYKRTGLTWPRRTTSGLSMRVLPPNCIFADKGPAIFANENKPDDLLALLSVVSSEAFKYLVGLQLAAADAAARSYEVGVIQKTPVPDLPEHHKSLLSHLGRKAWAFKRQLDSVNETSHAFILPKLLRARSCKFDPQAISNYLNDIQFEIDQHCFQLYGFAEEDKAAAIEHVCTQKTGNGSAGEEDDDAAQASSIANNEGLLSWAVGVVFGRFDWRLATGERSTPEEPQPFDALLEISPGMLQLGSTSFHQHQGVLIDEPGHQHDLAALMEAVLIKVGVESPFDVSRWLSKEFYALHLKMYSKSRRQAPIYWPLQTPSGSYTLWVYYHRLNEQTLYTCVNDFIEPKLQQVEQDLNGLRSKSARNTQEEKELEKLSDLASELRDFRDELLRLAKFWKPNLNDGVQITAAPLWKLFQHKAWQKKLKETWDSLEKGDYDWAHLACSIWPERVLRKCHQDRSLAIAHDVEEYFWHEVEVPVKRGKKLSGETKLEWQPKELNEPALLAVIKQIKEERGL